MRRPLLTAVVACAAGGLVVVVAAGRTWGAATVRTSGGARQHVAVSGHTVASALPALGLALLALSVAILAAAGIVRRLAGLLVVVVGAAAVAVSLHARGDVGHALAARVFATTATSVGGTRAAWWLVATLGGAVAAAAGAAVVVGAAGRARLGARYEAPAAASTPSVGAVDDWDAIERGQDPTVGR